MRGDLLHFLLQALHGIEDGRATQRECATAIGSTSLWGGVGVAMHDQDVVYRNPKFLGDDLRERGLFALPMRRGARVDHHRPTLLDAHPGALVETDW